MVAFIALLEEHNHMTIDSFDLPIDLTGQVALITGGGRGLGRAFAQALAARGAAVAITARSQAEVQETAHHILAAGGHARAFPGDVTDAPTVTHMVEAVEQHFGPIDILVNNAGVITPIGPLWEVDPIAWWHTLDWSERVAQAHPDFPATIAALLTVCRREGIDVIHLRASFSADRSDWMPTYLLRGRTPCVQGTAGIEPLPFASENVGETIMRKHTFDGFQNGELEQ